MAQYLISSHRIFFIAIFQQSSFPIPTDFEQKQYIPPPFPFLSENRTLFTNHPVHPLARLDSTPSNQLLQNDPFNIYQPRPDIKLRERNVSLTSRQPFCFLPSKTSYGPVLSILNYLKRNYSSSRDDVAETEGLHKWLHVHTHTHTHVP